ncbi:protein FAM92A [Caerostris extrusa]|uniref:Protein FAM92A n=1 Tax=Caerostris extrusa TaxID=172846 RepID=A0AAV4W0K4_CAEEX|nr:protein FAM92A [Caerostris extrusa]
MAIDLRSSELEHTFIKERICSVEKHFAEISSKLSTYNKKLAFVRDSGDDLAKVILNFASKENLNSSLRSSLMQFADLLIAIQEYRDAQCDLKNCFEIRVKEINKKNQLEKTRGKNPTNWQKIAERALSQAKDEATQTTIDLSKKIDNFERQKIEDLKHVFLEFIKIEMIFHAKAIELYTTAYNTIKNIKVEEDLKEFQSHFRSYTSPHLSMEFYDAKGNSENHADHRPLTQNKSMDIPSTSTNTSSKTSVQSKVSVHTPNSSSASLSSKKHRESKMSDSPVKQSPFKAENSTSSFGSFNESKFDFGDHCL